MRRRDFIALVGGAAAWPLTAGAQQPVIPLIGFLDSGPPRANEDHVAAFRRGLADAGYVEGRNVAIEYRWASNRSDRLPMLAEELVSRRVSVIVAVGSLAPGLAAKKTTSTIPIVFVVGGDPVKYGLVESLNRPGGNLTGVTTYGQELAGKRLNLLHELVPQARTVAFLSGTPSYLSYQEQTGLMLEAGHALGLQVLIVECRNDRDFERAFKTMMERRVEALILGTFPFGNLNRVVALAARDRLPAMYPARALAVEGGLVSYGAEVTLYRQIATQYVARLLKGAKPADLPVQQPTTFELVLNLKTARALGLDVPTTLLTIADEVIE